MCLVGCHNEAEVESEAEEVIEEKEADTTAEDQVKLENVTRPVVGEPYMVLVGESAYDVLWGDGYPCYLTVDSGLPGFGYPMLIVGEEFNVGDTITLETSYGDYEYRGGEEADVDDINFGKQEEVLYLQNEDGSCTSYELESGPEIVE